MGRSPDDDQDVAVTEDGARRREVDTAGEQVALLAHVGDRVLGELGEGDVDPARWCSSSLASSEVCNTRPVMTSVPRRMIVPPSTVIGSPSFSVSKSPVPGTSISRMPACVRSRGPAFG